MISKKVTGILLLIGLPLLLFVSILFDIESFLMIGILVFYATAVFFLYKPFFGLLVFLLLRPSTDFFIERISITVFDVRLTASALFGILIIALALLFVIYYHEEIFPMPLFLPFFLLVLTLAASILYSIDPVFSMRETVRVCSIFALFILTWTMLRTHPERRRTFFSVILVSAIIPTLASLFQLVTGTGFSDTADVDGRLLGTFSNPNTFAAYVMIVGSVFFFFALQTKKWSPQWFGYWCGTVGSLAILVGTYSRGAWLGFIIFALLYGAFRSPRSIFAVFGISLVLFFASVNIRDRVEDIYNPPADSSILWRLTKWKNTIESYKEAPLLGFGAGTEVIVHELHHGYNAGNPYTHNDSLKLLLENGIFGFVFHTMLLFNVLFLLFKKYNATKRDDQKDFVMIIALLFIAEVSFGMSSNIWAGTAMQWLLWSLLALTLSLRKDAPVIPPRKIA